MNHDCYNHHVRQHHFPCTLYNWYDHGWHYPWNLYYVNWSTQGQQRNWSPYYRQLELRDYGPYPLVINIEEAAEQNNTFRTALWTGEHLQVTLMSIDKGEDIGLEVHPHTDQFIRIEEGQGFVQMGDSKDRLDFTAEARKDDAIIIPAGKWHNVTNTGHEPLKIYVIYAPPEHPFGTVHETKAIALAAE